MGVRVDALQGESEYLQGLLDAKTGFDDLKQVLALMGVEPEGDMWDQIKQQIQRYNSKVEDAEL